MAAVRRLQPNWQRSFLPILDDSGYAGPERDPQQNGHGQSPSRTKSSGRQSAAKNDDDQKMAVTMRMLAGKFPHSLGRRKLRSGRSPAALVMHENRQQNNDRQRDAEQPKQ
jgi:hypothetical protein